MRNPPGSEPVAIFMLRTGTGCRLRDTRLDILPASDNGSPQIWIADGDRGEVLLKIPLEHMSHLLSTLTDAIKIAAAPPPWQQWYGAYPPEGSPGGAPMRISWFESENPSSVEVAEQIAGSLRSGVVHGVPLADVLKNIEEYVSSTLVEAALPELRAQVSDPVALGWLEIYADPARYMACKTQAMAPLHR